MSTVKEVFVCAPDVLQRVVALPSRALAAMFVPLFGDAVATQFDRDTAFPATFSSRTVQFVVVPPWLILMKREVWGSTLIVTVAADAATLATVVKGPVDVLPICS
jgi:hypothetical protein